MVVGSRVTVIAEAAPIVGVIEIVGVRLRSGSRVAVTVNVKVVVMDWVGVITGVLVEINGYSVESGVEVPVGVS